MTPLQQFIENSWNESIRSTLEEYIRIPNVSPHYDAQWQEKGHMDDAVKLLSDWVTSQNVQGLTQEVIQLEGETPVLFIEIPGSSEKTILLYGHLDKQPPMEGWREDLGPFNPVIEGDRLYGRGGADDGYALFGSLTAIKALQAQGVEHPRCVILIEGAEESGSYNLPKYVDHLKDRIGNPSLIVCLDSGAGDYERLWMTTSLRGVVGGVLRVDVVDEGLHSGDASGVVPSSFRIARTLLSRLEDEETGKLKHDDFYVTIPEERLAQIQVSAEVLGEEWLEKYHMTSGMRAVTDTVADALRARTWEPALSITGASGLPEASKAGNVLRPYTELKLSLRLPPGCDADTATAKMKEILESDAPYGAKVTFTPEEPANGWNAPVTSAWLNQAIEQASQEHYGQAPCLMGEGGSIPFMHMLGQKFPEAQFVITGVLGPESNAHGPNEFLHIPMFKRITACIADILKSAQENL